MIPKMIHYCWFGGAPLPQLAIKCIDSWKKHCPDYEIKEWNESNFDINYNLYVNEAYEAKKWAFVSDVARLWVLVNYGGIYMDTDCELIKPMNDFLHLDAVAGFEIAEAKIQTALMCCRAGYELFAELLDDYKTRRFILSSGGYDTTTNVTIITRYLLERGLLLNNKFQTISGLTIYPSEYFSPKDGRTGVIAMTDSTYAVHHFDGSWFTDEQRKEHAVIASYRKRYGNLFGLILYVLVAFCTLRKNAVNSIVEKVRNRRRNIL